MVDLIQKRISDNNTFWLIRKIIKSFSVSPGRGLPLGNITSQLFANIYLNELDQFIKQKLRIRYYIRYCDDFLVLSDSREVLNSLIAYIDDFLKEKLRLSLHPNKVIIKKYHQGIDFLGYVSFPHHRILRTKTKRRMFQKLDQKIQRLEQNKTTKDSFNQTIQSYLGLLKHCRSYKLQRKILARVRRVNVRL